MKYLLLMAALINVSAAVAQNDPYKDYLQKNKVLVIPMTRNNDTLLKQFNTKNDALAAFPDAKFESILSNGSKIYALPQDNMPCVVPDMNQFSMPNSGSNKVRIYTYNGSGAIPNPARPQQKAVILSQSKGVLFRTKK